MQPTDRVKRILACPTCGSDLRVLPGLAQCTGCSQEYGGAAARGSLDLRLKTPRKYRVDFDLPARSAASENPLFERLKANPSPQVADYPNVPISLLQRMGNRMTPELLSYFPYASNGGLMLDLGCGNRDLESVCRCTNMEYLGLDYTGDAPDILGDAHALPFHDESFDFVLSMAVLEHLRYPHVAMAEAFRVLKPGGVFIGTVAFLEPFHMDSYAHLTHLGTYSVLSHAGFTVEAIAPNDHWSGVHALASMILYPRLPKLLCDLVVLPAWLLHRAWWKLGHLVEPKFRTSEPYRLLATTGGFRFVAKRPKPGDPADAR